jgi:cell division protein FtsZ
MNQRPAIYRKAATAGGNTAEAIDNDLDYLDIPAFLRRQAD